MYRRWPWLNNLFYPFVLVLMISCITFAVVGWVESFMPESWSGLYIVLTVLIISFVAMFNDRFERVLVDGGEDRLVAAVSMVLELLILIMLLRTLRYLGHSFVEIVEEIQRWPVAPLSILDFEFLLGLLITIPAWMGSVYAMTELERTGVRPELYKSYVSPLHRLTAWFYWGGSVLLAATGLINMMEPEMRAKTYHPNVFALNMLIYFVFGLLILAMGRMVSLSQQWYAERIEIPAGFAARWLKAVLLLLGLALVVTLLLPTGQTIALFDMLGGKTQQVVSLVTAASESSPQFQVPVLLWLVMGGVCSLVIYSYLTDHPAIYRSEFFVSLRRWWQTFRK